MDRVIEQFKRRLVSIQIGANSIPSFLRSGDMDFDTNCPGEPRKSDRVPLAAKVGIRRSGSHGYRVRVFDASPEGCKIEFVERPTTGQRVWARFDGLEPLGATVRWAEGHIGGVQFERPLHEAAFQRVVSAKPDERS
jgi:hypothetical protein